VAKKGRGEGAWAPGPALTVAVYAPKHRAAMSMDRGTRAAIGVGLAATVPALFVGFVHDDLTQRLGLEGGLPGYAPGPFRLYKFTWGGAPQVEQLIREGRLPWFSDPGLSINFFRPFASLTLAFDSWAFGRSPIVAHLHSFAWFALLLVTVAALYRRWLPRREATWALLVYGLAGGHAMTTGWLSARHGLVGATFGALALLAHAKFRDGGFRAGAFLAPLALAAGLASSEVALGAVAFVACDEAIARRGPARERALGALPSLAVVAAYLVFYAAGGYGTKNSSAYISPFDDPAAFAVAIVERVPLLFAEIYAALPSALAAAAEPLVPTLNVLGALATLGVGLALRARRGAFDEAARRRLLALGLAAALALLPTAGAISGGRVLPLASIGGAALVGALIVAASGRARETRGARRLGWGAVATLLAVLHLGLSPLVRVGTPLAFRKNSEDERVYADRAEVDGCPSDGVAYVLNGSDPVNSLYAAPSLIFYRPERAARLREVRVLSMAPTGLRMRGLGEGAFELETLGARRATFFERVYRDSPMREGDAVRAGGLSARVLAVDGGMPTRVAFRVEGGLGGTCFLAWHDGKLGRVATPEVGVTVEVPYEQGPMGM
jgi:hypothetical protein